METALWSLLCYVIGWAMGYYFHRSKHIDQIYYQIEAMGKLLKKYEEEKDTEWT